jgi:omega-amidase
MMGLIMRIALSSLDQVWENKEENLVECNKFSKIASENKAGLIIFPEMTLTGFTLNTTSVSEDYMTSVSLQNFSNMADVYNIGIVAGIVLKNKNIIQNTAISFGNDGKVLAEYAKIHPFSFVGEDEYISGGTKLSVFEFNKIRLGLTICYDLRFPLLWASLANECDCIINIANWPEKRVDHWYALLQARAIENQLYVIGVNRIGVDGNGIEYIESSRAYGPDGSIVNSYVVDKSLSIIDIDKTIVDKWQRDFPIRNDRRPSIYKNL